MRQAVELPRHVVKANARSLAALLLHLLRQFRNGVLTGGKEDDLPFARRAVRLREKRVPALLVTLLDEVCDIFDSVEPFSIRATHLVEIINGKD